MQSIRICPSFPRLNILSLPGLVAPEGSLRPCLLAQDGVHTNTQEVVVQWKCFPECNGTLRQAGSADIEMTTGEMLPCQDARGLWKQGDDIITPEQSIPTFPLPWWKARRWAETEALTCFLTEFQWFGPRVRLLLKFTHLLKPVYFVLFSLLQSLTRGLWPLFWGVSLNSAAL